MKQSRTYPEYGIRYVGMLCFFLTGILTLHMPLQSDAQIVLVDPCSGAPATAPQSNIYGPMSSLSAANATSRTAVIFPRNQLVALAGQTITSTYFYRRTTSGAMSATATFKIYLKEVAANDWGLFTNPTWASAISGATLVYNANPSTAVGTTAGWKEFESTTNFVYSGNQNLAVMMEYVNTSASATIEWSYENAAPCIDNTPDDTYTTVYTRNTVGTPGATLSSKTQIRPYIGFDILVNCNPATNVTVPPANITTTTATIQWTAPSPAPAGGYEYYLSNSSATPNAATVPTGTTAAGVTSKALTALMPGTAYRVWVRAVCSASNKSPWTNKVEFNTLLTNDEAASAIPLTVNAASNCSAIKAGVTYGATESDDAKSGCYDDEPIEDVWYSFIATSKSHSITFSNVTRGEMVANVYAGSLGALSAFACVLNTSPTITGLSIGETYYIRVYTFPPTVGPVIQTDFSICVSTPAQIAPPANDECVNAILLSVNANTSFTNRGSGTLTGATPSPAPNSICNLFNDVWFKFVATNAVHIITIPPEFITGSTTDFSFQVLDTCGATSEIFCSNALSDAVTGLTPGSTYWVRVASSNPNAETVNFQIAVTTPPNMSYTSSTSTQASTATAAAGSVNQQIIRVAITMTGSNAPLSITQLNFTTTGSTNASAINYAKVFYTEYSTTFSNANLFGSVTSPNGAFVVNGNQLLQNKTVDASVTHYFWLVYDIACNATVGNVVDATCTSLQINGPRTPSVTAPAGSRSIAAAVSNTTVVTQASTASIFRGTNNATILRVSLSGCSNAPVTSLSFTTNGSTNASTSITAAKVFYTSNTTFATTTQFGTTTNNPNGAFTITGSQLLTEGTGYFWLAYDIAANATVNNVVDGTCTSAVINGSTSTPANTSPTGTRKIVAPLANDEATGAITLTVGANCTGAVYTNVDATKSLNEPYPACSNAANSPVWFKFIAPASGAVRISTDVGSGNSLSDTRVGLFSAANVNDYQTFNIISCDDNGGSALGFGNMSVLFATGLTAGTTYYVAVDNGAFGQGSFCITVAELSSAMLSANNTCASEYQLLPPVNPSYTGWLSLLDGSSKLVAMVKNKTDVDASLYFASQHIHTGTVRNANGGFYLNRSFTINHPNASNVEVKLFFLATEMTALTTADAGTNLTNIGISKQSNGGPTCFATFTAANGNITGISQTENGSASGVHWIGFTTPEFSNFYVQKQSAPLTFTWTGNASTAWENAANWSSNVVPSATSVVTIPAGRPRYPIVNNTTTVKSITCATGTSVSVAPGATLNVLK